MSLEKIVQEAVEARPLGLKEAFEEEMEKRILAALEEKATAAMMEADEDDDEERFSNEMMPVEGFNANSDTQPCCDVFGCYNIKIHACLLYYSSSQFYEFCTFYHIQVLL